jgi:hypothetical protein
VPLEAALVEALQQDMSHRWPTVFVGGGQRHRCRVWQALCDGVVEPALELDGGIGVEVFELHSCAGSSVREWRTSWFTSRSPMESPRR